MGRGRRTRPWARLRGPTEEANRLAELLRGWLDDAGLRLDDLLGELKPEHFESQTVPGRSTVADRLAGVNLRWDFVEAVADACSGSAAEYEGLRQQARPLHQAAVAAARHGRSGGVGRQDPSPGDARPGTPDPERELVVAQRRSLELSDQLMRALHRTAELEKARNDAHHMVLILLTLVDKLHRDIATLTAERDRSAARAPASEALADLQEQLGHSEAQRLQAEAELTRARDEREKADRLAEQSAEQVRRLTAELARLRLEQDAAHPEADAVPADPGPAPVLPTHPTAHDDIDIALMKAAHILDSGAERLDRLAEELREEPDGLPDNSAGRTPDNASDEALRTVTAAGESPDNEPDNKPDRKLDNRSDDQPHDEDDADVDTFVAWALELPTFDALEEAFPRLMTTGRDWPPGPLTAALQRLRATEATDRADALALAIGWARPAPGLVTLLGSLSAPDTDAVMMGMVERPARSFQQAIGHLRKAGFGRFAHRVLLAAGRHRSMKDLPLLLSSLPDESFADRVLLLNGVCARSAHRVAQIVQRLREVGMCQDAHLLTVAALANPGVTLTPLDSVPWGPEAWFDGAPVTSPHRPTRSSGPTDTVLTTRIRINIPGSRPIPPVVVRRRAAPPQEPPVSG
ncbi:hypothetical protein [Streptomyces sp. NPDC001851]|uniref:hypothetical protein n=1 Tax=Streptomyces sp. NPDC001851 TaxID=3154529 RepID=UPI00332FB6B6